jgi:hypothetical protein
LVTETTSVGHFRDADHWKNRVEVDARSLAALDQEEGPAAVAALAVNGEMMLRHAVA